MVGATSIESFCWRPGKRVLAPASRISSIWTKSKPASLTISVNRSPTCRYTGAARLSNRILLTEVDRSKPSFNDSTAQVAAPDEAERDRLVCSIARRSLASARLSPAGADSPQGRSRAVFVFFVNSFAKCLSNYTVSRRPRKGGQTELTDQIVELPATKLVVSSLAQNSVLSSADSNH